MGESRHTNQSLGNVLIIDDEEAILKMLSQTLTRRGYTPDIVTNAEEGLAKIQSENYSFIITDIKMPGISGAKVASEVKKTKGSQTPVIGMSGTPWLLDENLFDAVLPKPFFRKELIDIIDNLT
jgi:DNA-binding response OmpR family regulator